MSLTLDNLSIREMREEDCATISQAFTDQGWDKPTSQYERYLAEQKEGTRDVMVAFVGDEFAGYATIVWESYYPPFREARIPEINDFNVLEHFQRRGIGAALMDEAERRIGLRSPVAGLGVGLYADYGPAQILYAKRDYVPDGRGLMYDCQPVAPGETTCADDSLTIYLTKRLRED